MAEPKTVVAVKIEERHGLFEWVREGDKDGPWPPRGEIGDHAMALRQYSVFAYAHGYSGRYSR